MACLPNYGECAVRAGSVIDSWFRHHQTRGSSVHASPGMMAMLWLRHRNRSTLRAAPAPRRARLEVERLETRDLPASILGGPGVLLPTMPVHVDTEQANHVASVWNSVNNHVTTSITVAETVYQWGAPATHERVVIVEFITLTVTIRSVSPVVRLERED